MKNISKFLLTVFACTILSNKGSGQSFLNGSFEDNIANNCYYNITNSSFDSLMNKVKGIGNIEEIDILFDDSCPFFSYAEEGHYIVTLETNISLSTSTAISLELSDTLISGNTYAFSYFDRISSGFLGDSIEVGISSDSNTVGNIIYTSPIPISQSWTKRIVNFIAPLTGKYITARAKIGTPNRWVLIDNFSFDTTTVSVAELQPKRKVGKLFPNPNNGEMQYEYSLQNNSVGYFEMYDPMGRKLASYKLTEGANLLDINLKNISEGLYLYKVIVDNTIISSNRIAIIK